MKKKIILIIAIGVLILLTVFIKIDKTEPVPSAEKIGCDVSTKKMTVQGYSMYPFINPEKEITALFGYYDCHPIERGDVVLYKYSGNDNLLIKFVKAVPGDRWELKKGEEGCEIVVNGSVLSNSEGKPYSITDCKMLQLYVSDYPVIPENTYLLLGDKTDGSIDSTTFGLVSGDDIEAKVVF